MIAPAILANSRSTQIATNPLPRSRSSAVLRRRSLKVEDSPEVTRQSLISTLVVSTATGGVAGLMREREGRAHGRRCIPAQVRLPPCRHHGRTDRCQAPDVANVCVAHPFQNHQPPRARGTSAPGGLAASGACRRRVTGRRGWIQGNGLVDQSERQCPIGVPRGLCELFGGAVELGGRLQVAPDGGPTQPARGRPVLSLALVSHRQLVGGLRMAVVAGQPEKNIATLSWLASSL